MILQLLANGLVAGCSYALVALGFGLIYNTTRIFHFAHGAIYTFSIYTFYTLWSLCHLHILIALPASIAITAVAGILTDEIVYTPLIERRPNLIVPMISSLGLYIIIVNSIAMLYGNETMILRPGIQETCSMGGVILTRIQIITVVTFMLVFSVIFALLKKTNIGRTIRAMRDDRDLLSVVGINPKAVRRMVFGVGSALAALPAILSGLDVGFDPHIGVVAVLNGSVAVIIGGVGIFEGAVLGAMLLGLLQSLTVWVTSARWQETITFTVFMIFLLLLPEGILGRHRRVEEN